jgi:hypothetical protein
MFVSKKEPKTYASTRYSNKKSDNQIFISTCTPRDTISESLRNSGEKILRLRGNSKNGGIKMVSKEKVKAEN